MGAVQHELGSRDRILLAARSSFAGQGFHQTPMAELAQAAQVSVGQIYRLFKDKEDIIAAIVAADADERVAEISLLCERAKRGELSIERTFELMALTVIDTEEEALSFDILAEAFRNPAVGETITAMCVRYRAVLRECACIANPGLSDKAIDAAEEVIMACMFGLGHRSLSMPKLSSPEAAQWAARLIMASLRTVEAGQQAPAAH
ncbi:MAG: helix-turn-helix domain-containing protein [Sphingobium sp.]|nr:helix-turn-helix domain-containing protein [Sphingobium sp.]